MSHKNVEISNRTSDLDLKINKMNNQNMLNENSIVFKLTSLEQLNIQFKFRILDEEEKSEKISKPRISNKNSI